MVELLTHARWRWLGAFLCLLALTKGLQDFNFPNTDHYLMSVFPEGKGVYDCSNQNHLQFLMKLQPTCLFCYQRSGDLHDIDIRNGTCKHFGFGCSRKCCQGIIRNVHIPAISKTLPIVTSCACGSCSEDLEDVSLLSLMRSMGKGNGDIFMNKLASNFGKKFF